MGRRSKFGTVATLLVLLVAAGIAGLAGQGRGVAGQPPAPARQPGHGAGKLMIWGDTALFEPPPHPQNCSLMNRFKRGQPVGFRMTAMDGGTAEVENTALLVAHVAIGGRTVDVPMRWRGEGGPDAPVPRGHIRVPLELWTGKWIVPNDAPIGAVTYTVTATDAFGRTATFRPFSATASQLTIVE